jgi:hypothetical protein
MSTSYTLCAQQQQQQQTIKPSFPISEIIFIIQLLDKIELKGSEVDALLEVKSLLIIPVVNAQKENKPITELLSIDFKVQQEQVLLGLLQRAKLNGAEAERYKRFIDTIIIAANPKK